MVTRQKTLLILIGMKRNQEHLRIFLYFKEKYQLTHALAFIIFKMIADIEYSLNTTDLFVLNCPIVKEDLERFHEKTQKIIDKISNNNFYLLIFLLIIFIFYYVIKKIDLKKLIINKPV